MVITSAVVKIKFLYKTASVNFSKAEIELLYDFEKLNPESRAVLCELIKHMK